MVSTRKKSAASLPGLSAPTVPAVKPIEKFHNALALSPRLEASAYIDNIVEFGSLFR